MKLPDNLRSSFKNPMGILIEDHLVTKDTISSYIDGYNIITVGDVTTEKLISFGINPILQIIDGKTKRGEYNKLESNTPIEVNVKNPAGEITQEALWEIEEAFMMEESTRLVVDGEEDLLVLPVCMYAPNNSVVLYGQPNEGIVIVNITQEVRDNCKHLMEKME